MPEIIIYAASGLGENGQFLTITEGIPVYIRQHSCTFPTPIPEGALPHPDALTIKTVTPITCHQSQITGESTCPMDVCIPSANRLIHSTSLTTFMTWLMFVNLDPRSYRSMRVALMQVQIRKIQQEMQGSRQERAQEQRPASGTRAEAVCKKTRC